MRGWLSLLAIGLLLAAADSNAIEEQPKLSGLEFVSPETRSLQADDASNPGMLWVLRGEQLWQEPAGRSQASCASCHGEARQSMRGVALRYPAFDAGAGQPIDLKGRINRCRTDNQDAPALEHESEELLALTTYVAHQSRGMSVPPVEDERLRSVIEQGESLFRERIGQLDLSCAACHDDRWGQRLGSSPIPQAHPTAYPLYRLEWQTVGSLQRRLRNCMIGVRAEPFAYGSPEFIALELYLMQRAEGLPVETPGVRP